jgi:hypothetical protein
VAQPDGQLCLEMSECAEMKVFPVLISNGPLSIEARKLSELSGVKYRENWRFDRNYPKLKCVAVRDGRRLYLGPSVYSYDSISVRVHSGDRYVRNEQEAERLGYELHPDSLVLFSAPKRCEPLEYTSPTEDEAMEILRHFFQAWETEEPTD